MPDSALAGSGDGPLSGGQQSAEGGGGGRSGGQAGEDRHRQQEGQIGDHVHRAQQHHGGADLAQVVGGRPQNTDPVDRESGDASGQGHGPQGQQSAGEGKGQRGQPPAEQ